MKNGENNPHFWKVQLMRTEYHAFVKELEEKAKEMKVRVPKAHYVPSRQVFYSAGNIAKMIGVIRRAFNQDPQIEFSQSFSAWWPKTAGDIVRTEIYPMIHERINIRALI